MKIIYPVNCREVNEDLGQDELIRRLKALAHTFQTLGQDSQEEGKYNDFKPLAHHLAEEFFLNHPSKDVQLLIACCIADILRIFAPEAPYVEPDEIKSVFYFLIRQLNGLRDPKDPAFKRYFYLLENLAYVKSFNMCFELPDESQQIFCQLFHTFFSIINDEHSHKVRNYMLEVMHPLVAESDQISDEWLNTIMRNIVEENKVSRNAYLLAKELVQKTSTVLQPFLQSFFNRELLLDSKGGGEPKKYAISERLYEFIYALNTICPDVLMSVVPQLEYKLRSADEKDRYGAVSLLARMFSERGSNLARDHRQLWNTFLGRFNDIKPNIRTKCVQYSMHFLLNHPGLREDLVEALKSRQHDAEESVRYEVVTAIVSTARREYEIVAQSKELLSFVRERTLDKKFKIRREAMSGLAFVYKKRTILADGTIIPHQSENQDSLAWVKNKLLYGYYMNMLDDRLLVEKLLNTTLVPYQMRVEDRMLMMLSLVSTIDEKAAKAFAEIMKNRATVRRAVHKLLQVYSDTNLSESQKENELRLHVISLSKSLPDEIKAREFLMKFVHHMEDDTVLLNKMNRIVDPAVSCRECAEAVNMVLKKLGQPIMTNLYYNTVKSLLERASSVLVDDEAVKMLLEYILLLLRGTVDGNPVADLDGDPVIICTKGLQLLHLLATTQPQSFSNEEALRRLYDCIGAVSAGDTEEIHCLVLSIFAVLGKCTPIIRTCPDVYKELLEFGIINIKHGTPKVAKHSVRAILANGDDDKEVDQQLLETIESIRENLDVENEFCRTALSAIGHIAVLAPRKFPIQIKNIISKRVVKDLLMKQKKPTLSTSDDWCKEEALPEETRCKLEGLKVISRWLIGLKDERIFAKKTFRMLNAFIVNNGDLGLSQDFKLSEAEKSYLRLGAACCMLKICQQKGVGDEFNAEQFYNLSRLMADPVAEVRGNFFQKLHKGLSAGIPNNCLPLDFLGFYALCGLESNRQLRSMAKQQMIHNVNRRRDYIKSLLLHGGEKASEQLPHVLPDFVLVFGVPVLAHSSSFVDPTNVEQLMRMRNCLWFILEPVVTKNENFCFTFLKSLTDAMKVKVDAVDPTDDTTNHKLWALCDLALGLIMSKTANYETKEYLTEPRVPEIYFKTPARPIDDNINKPYLPEEVRLLAMRKPTVVGKVLAETPAPGRSGGGTSRTVMETVRDKDTLLTSDEEADASGGRPKRGGRLNKGDKRGRSDEDSEEEPFPRESPERQYSRNPANTYRVEEKDITLDEFGGSHQASVSVPELLEDGHGADHDLEHGEDADGDEGLENEEESARPTRARKAPKAAPVKRGASKTVPEANGKKAKMDVPANNATARSTRRQQQQSGDVSDENVELEQASAKTAGKTKKAVPAKEPPLTSGTRTSGRLRR